MLGFTIYQCIVSSRYYAEVNRCGRNMTLSMCKLDQSMEDAANFLYDSFNPFCPDGKDPRITSLHTSPEEQKTTTENTGIAHTHSPLLVILSVIISKSSW